MFRKITVGLVAMLTIVAPFSALAAESPKPAAPEVLTLDQCLDMAFKNNQQLKVAAKNVDITKEAVKEAEAAFWPAVNYKVDQSYSSTEQYKFDNKYRDSQVTGGVSGTLPLYSGGSLEKKLKLAQINLESAKESERSAKQQLTFSVKQAYYNVWLTDQSLKVAQSSYDNMDKHFQRIETLYKVGTASKFDLLRAEVQRDKIKPDVISAQNKVVLAKLQLATAIGFPKEKQFAIDFDATKMEMPESVKYSLQVLLETAYRDRVDFHQIHQLAESKKLQTELTQIGVNRPSVDLTAAYGATAKDISLGSYSGAYTLTLEVKGNIFNKANKSKVEQAKGNEELVAIQEADLKDKVRLEVEQSIQSLSESIEITRANQASIDLGKESLRLTQARFEAGMATTMDIMDAQLALDQALNGYYQGIVGYLTAEAKIDLVTGKN